MCQYSVGSDTPLIISVGASEKIVNSKTYKINIL